MLLLFIIALLGFEDCTAGGVLSDLKYVSGYDDVIGQRDYVGGYDDVIGQRDYVIPYIGEKEHEKGHDKWDCYDYPEHDKCRQSNRKCRDNYKYDEGDEKYDTSCDYDGGNDHGEQIVRPCKLDDNECIRKYLARNSKCKPTYGPMPDPLYLKRFSYMLPVANLTIIGTRIRITGINTFEISEFYVNRHTGSVVLAVDFKSLNHTSDKALHTFQRFAKESIIMYDYTSYEFHSGTLTAVIPTIPHLRLDLAEVHIYFQQPPTAITGPNAITSTDPEVMASVATLFSNLGIVAQEAFLYNSQLLMAIFIQETLCDFGVDKSSI